MRIRSLQISGLYSYGEKVTIQFPNPTMTTIVGPNNAGKSNIFRIVSLVIDTLSDRRRGLADSEVHPDANKPMIEIKLSLSRREAELILGFLSYYQVYNEQNNASPMFYEFKNKDFLATALSEVTIKIVWGEYYVQRGEWSPSEIELVLDAISLKLFATTPRQDLTAIYHSEHKNGQLLVRDFLNELHDFNSIQNPFESGDFRNQAIVGFSTQTMQMQTLSERHKSKLRELLVYAGDKYSSKSEYLWFTTFLGIMMDKSIFRSGDRRILTRQEDLSPEQKSFTLNEGTAIEPVERLESDGSNLPLFMYSLMHSPMPDKRNRFRQIQASFSELFRMQKLKVDIILESQERTLLVHKEKDTRGYESFKIHYPVIVIHDQLTNKQIPLDRAGAGISEIIFLLTLTYGNKDSVLLLDEPASNLHSPLMKAFFRGVVRTTDDMNGNQVIITTHSPDLTRFALFEAHSDLLYVTRNENARTSSVNSLDSDSKNWLKLNLGKLSYQLDTRVFFGKKVILTEGEADRNFILGSAQHFAQDNGEFDLDNKDIVVIVVYGKENFPKYKRLIDAFLIPYSIVGDKDVQVTSSADVKNIFNSASTLSKNALTINVPGIFIIKDGNLEDLMRDLDPAIFGKISKQLAEMYGPELPKPLLAALFIGQLSNEKPREFASMPVKEFLKILISR